MHVHLFVDMYLPRRDTGIDLVRQRPHAGNCGIERDVCMPGAVGRVPPAQDVDAAVEDGERRVGVELGEHCGNRGMEGKAREGVVENER